MLNQLLLLLFLLRQLLFFLLVLPKIMKSRLTDYVAKSFVWLA